MPIEAHPPGGAEPRPTSPILSPYEALPGLATALDEESMRGHLQAALFGGDRTRYTVERCRAMRPLYLPGDCCVVRYRFQARQHATGSVLRPIVMGRVYPDRSPCEAYTREKLAPLAARMRDRPEVTAFAAPAAMIDALNMVVHVWPIDGELPTLVDATDPRHMSGVFRETLPEALGQAVTVDDCRIELVSYRRRQRCVLRYTVELRTPGRHEVRPLIVYGKVSASGDETLTSRIIAELRERIAEPAARYRFSLPRSLGSRPDLGLSLLEALPGAPQVGAALRSRMRGRPSGDGLSVEELVARCGQVGAMLHTSGIALGRRRKLDDELAGLRPHAAMARQFAPGFGDRANSSLERIAAVAERSEPLAPRLSHGDFKQEQLLFDGAACGLVDFDAVCQAEPALDVGSFVAHLRAEAETIQAQGSPSSSLGDELAEQFLGAYLVAAEVRGEDEQRLRVRTTLHETTTLLRLALRSQLDLDEPRLETIGSLLEARLAAVEEGRFLP